MTTEGFEPGTFKASKPVNLQQRLVELPSFSHIDPGEVDPLSPSEHVSTLTGCSQV